MSPPDPPAPSLPKLTLNTANAQGVKYLGDYTSFAEPDLQSYSSFTVDGVQYTVNTSGGNICYLLVDRSANEGDDVKIGFMIYATRVIYYDGQSWKCDSSGNITAAYGSSDLKPVCSPANTALDAIFNSSDLVNLFDVII